MSPPILRQVLVAVPAFNEEGTIRDIVRSIRSALPDFDLLVVNDGSQDRTGEVLNALKVVTATHYCNLGYGRAIQTAIQYALRNDYEVLVTLDADGQHRPEQIQAMVREFFAGEWDMLIGSRFVESRKYSGVPLARRIGMQLFSAMVRLVAAQRVYDTTSGLKVMRRCVFDPLTRGHFVDFHSDAIVYLIHLGYQVGEYPVTMLERKMGQSMHNALSLTGYPLKTALVVLLGMVDAEFSRRQGKK